MKKRQIFLLFLGQLACMAAVFAQSPVLALKRKAIDSLTVLLQDAKADTRKVDWMNLRANHLIELDNDKAKKDSEAALALAEKLDYPQGISRSYKNLAELAFREKDFAENISCFEKAMDCLDSTKDYAEMVDLRTALLNTFFFIADYPRAMKESLEGLKLARQLDDKKYMASYTNLLGFIYYKQRDVKQAKPYFRQYLELARESGDERQIANAYSNISDIYNEEKKYDSAFASLSKTLEIYKKLNDKASVALTYYNIGHSFFLKGTYDSALVYTSDALEQAKKTLPNLYDVARYHIGMGEIYIRLDNARQAIPALHEGLSLSQKIEHRENIKEAYYNLSDAFSKQGNADSALFYYKRFSLLKDSLVNEQSIREIDGMVIQHEVEKKDREIELLNKKNELKETETRKKDQARNFIIGIIVLVSGILFLLYNKYRLNKENKLQQQVNRQQNELFNSVVTTQEKERKRIAEDLHDGLGSILSTAKLNLELMEKENLELNPEQLQKYQSALHLLDEALVELRHVSHHIMPATLSKLGLLAALQNLFDRISSFSGMQVSFITHDYDSRPDEHVEISIYHIILELMNNIVRHADAKEATVQLIRFPGYVNITVEDNGKGFDMEQAKNKRGIGLSNIISRVNYLSGKIDIDSAPGSGTTVIIDIPLV
ncbi:MAG: signal transduction histidine kinase [Bacteroidetes bacterium]|nr:MAG: signal transduction histidine kinase [Bacteroidota bacterium]